MQKLIQFCLHSAGTNSNRGDWGILILRFFFGLTMALSHGMNKTPPSEGFIAVVTSMGFPFASFFAWFRYGGCLFSLGFIKVFVC